ncbi:MAG: hypothetical protein VZR06_15220 [Butyrivibrio sp.]|nr:hypothetical protein [Butyrivibrio sp.]
MNQTGLFATRNKSASNALRMISNQIRKTNKAQSDEEKGKHLGAIQAKLRAGKKLTSEEMDYLRANDPEAYMHALRIQQARKSLESSLKHAKSKQEAQEIISSAVSGITKDDPDREAMIAAVSDVMESVIAARASMRGQDVLDGVPTDVLSADKFMKSAEYNKLPATDDEAKKKQKNQFSDKVEEDDDNDSRFAQFDGEPTGTYQSNGVGAVEMSGNGDCSSELSMVG